MAMNDILRKVLLEHYKLPASEIDEDSGWFRFRINEQDYQGGEDDGELRFSIDMDEIDHETDFNLVYKAMQQANRKLDGDVLMGEEDNYFKVLYSLRPVQVTLTELPQWLDEMARVADSAEVGAVIADYRQW